MSSSPDAAAVPGAEGAASHFRRVVLNGQVYSGTDGGAGDIGHVKIAGYDHLVCQCGAHGCLAAAASGRDRTLWMLDRAAAGTLPARLGRIASP